MQISPDPSNKIMLHIWLHNLIDQVIPKYGEIEKQRQKGHTLQPNCIILKFAKNVFEKVEDHALIESKLSTQEVQLTRTIIFKM